MDLLMKILMEKVFKQHVTTYIGRGCHTRALCSAQQSLSSESSALLLLFAESPQDSRGFCLFIHRDQQCPMKVQINLTSNLYRTTKTEKIPKRMSWGGVLSWYPPVFPGEAGGTNLPSKSGHGIQKHHMHQGENTGQRYSCPLLTRSSKVNGQTRQDRQSKGQVS